MLKTVEAVYIYIYIERSNRIKELNIDKKISKEKEAMYFRRT